MKELKLPNEFGVSVMAIKSGDDLNISPYAEDIIRRGDTLIVIGDNSSLKKLEQE